MKFLFFLSAGLVVLVAFTLPDFSGEENRYQQEKVFVVMRRIGDELLNHAGDKYSRVLPVEKRGEDSYVLKFESPIEFETSILVDVVQKHISDANLPSRYIVSVLGCGNDNILYSYEYTATTDKDSLNCLTRNNERGCYHVQISFAPEQNYELLTSGSILISLLILSITGFVYLRNQKIGGETSVNLSSGIRIGATFFDFGTRQLNYNGQTTDLTEKEARILNIFANKQNEIVERDLLLKEVWEDEGVFVGRSLDVFISRLRKKLESDSSVSLANVHGRGYRLEDGRE